MPKAERMRLAGSPSLTARISGMPPAVESVARAGEIGVGDAAEHEPAAGALLHLGAVALEHLDHTAAHRAEPQEGDLDLVHHTMVAPGTPARERRSGRTSLSPRAP